jgi:hypothetical protein
MRRPIRFLILFGVAMLAVGVKPAAAHDPWIGIRVGYYDFDFPDRDRVIDDDSGVSLGVELLTRIAHRVYFNPNIDYIFVDGGKEATFNADFHYDFPTHSRTMVWLGAGAGIHWQDPNDDLRFRHGVETETDPLVNLFVGVGYNGHGAIPYAQVKYVASSNPGFQLMAGLRF